jgi:hypothetical protein
VLRITVEKRDEARTLKVEGNLQGEWVGELRRAWWNIRDIAATAPIRVELADVPFVDAAGKVLLTEMHRQGVEITALGVLARSICDEIITGAAPVGAADVIRRVVRSTLGVMNFVALSILTGVAPNISGDIVAIACSSFLLENQVSIFQI